MPTTSASKKKKKRKSKSSGSNVVYYKEEVLGKHADIKFEIDGQEEMKFYRGQIWKMEVTLLPNGSKEYTHFLAFEDGDELWVDLAAYEASGRLKWVPQQKKEEEEEEEEDVDDNFEEEKKSEDMSIASDDDEEEYREEESDEDEEEEERKPKPVRPAAVKKKKQKKAGVPVKEGSDDEYHEDEEEEEEPQPDPDLSSSSALAERRQSMQEEKEEEERNHKELVAVAATVRAADQPPDMTSAASALASRKRTRKSMEPDVPQSTDKSDNHPIAVASNIPEIKSCTSQSQEEKASEGCLPQGAETISCLSEYLGHTTHAPTEDDDHSVPPAPMSSAPPEKNSGQQKGQAKPSPTQSEAAVPDPAASSSTPAAANAEGDKKPAAVPSRNDCPDNAPSSSERVASTAMADKTSSTATKRAKAVIDLESSSSSEDEEENPDCVASDDRKPAATVSSLDAAPDTVASSPLAAKRRRNDEPKTGRRQLTSAAATLVRAAATSAPTVVTPEKRPAKKQKRQSKPRRRREIEVIDVEAKHFDFFDFNSDEIQLNDLEYWLREVHVAPRGGAITTTNFKRTMLRVRDLVSGKGITYKNWPAGTYFYRGVKINLSHDFAHMHAEAKRFEQKHGKDLGNGWLLQHPIKKLQLYKEEYAPFIRERKREFLAFLNTTKRPESPSFVVSQDILKVVFTFVVRDKLERGI